MHSNKKTKSENASEMQKLDKIEGFCWYTITFEKWLSLIEDSSPNVLSFSSQIFISTRNLFIDSRLGELHISGSTRLCWQTCYKQTNFRTILEHFKRLRSSFKLEFFFVTVHCDLQE